MKENKNIKKVVFIGSDEFLIELKKSLKIFNIEVLLITNKDQNNSRNKEINKIITSSIKKEIVKKFLKKNNVNKDFYLVKKL